MLSDTSQLVLAAAFTVAALSKVLGLPDLRRTFEQLGIRQELSQPTAAGLIAVELLTGVALVAAPTQPWPRALVIALAAAFAAAGAKALVSKQPVSCNCFGSLAPGRLGWRQVWSLPCWIALVILASLEPPTWSPRQGLLSLSAAVTVLACCRIPAQLRLWRELRAERIALQDSWGSTTLATRPGLPLSTNNQKGALLR
ncbi:MAG: MauE/DoxX family redox-associated membrane protein [Egibacteraceae bacterium]